MEFDPTKPIEPEQFRVNVENLTEELCFQPVLHAHLVMLHVQAKKKLLDQKAEKVKSKRDLKSALAARRTAVRLKMKNLTRADGKAYTDKDVEESTKGDSEVLKLESMLVEIDEMVDVDLELAEDMLRGYLEVSAQRAAMLTTLGGRSREEMAQFGMHIRK